MENKGIIVDLVSNEEYPTTAIAAEITGYTNASIYRQLNKHKKGLTCAKYGDKIIVKDAKGARATRTRAGKLRTCVFIYKQYL
jgi:hypothetical protein